MDICHSERSEESLISSFLLKEGNSEMFRFAQHDNVSFYAVNFDLLTFSTFLTFGHANYRYRLSRRRFILVFLVRADLGGIEEALRRPRWFSLEDCADGSEWFANFTRAGAM